MAKTKTEVFADEFYPVEVYPNESLQSEINDYEEWKVVPKYEKERGDDGKMHNVLSGFHKMDGTKALRTTRISAYNAGVLNNQSENSGTRLIKIAHVKTIKN